MKEARLEFRLSEAEKEALKNQAQRSGLTMSEYLRLLAQRHIARSKRKSKHGANQ